MPDPRPWLIGEAPARTAELTGALHGRPASVLLAAMGEPTERADERLDELFRCANLFDTFQEAHPWRLRAARARADAFHMDHLRDGKSVITIVCLGRRVGHAFGLEKSPYGRWLDAGLLRIVVAPHPSGRSRLLNDPDARKLLGRVLNEAREEG